MDKCFKDAQQAARLLNRDDMFCLQPMKGLPPPLPKRALTKLKLAQEKPVHKKTVARILAVPTWSEP